MVKKMYKLNKLIFQNARIYKQEKYLKKFINMLIQIMQILCQKNYVVFKIIVNILVVILNLNIEQIIHMI